MDRVAVARELVKLAKSVVGGYTADDLFESVMMDIHPHGPAIVDFGLTDQKHFEALYYPIRKGEITQDDLRKVSGDGPAITKLVNRSRSNPHRGIKFETPYDVM